MRITAVRYDHGEPGKDFYGNWNYGNAYQYREADRMKMIPRLGKRMPGPKVLWNFYGYDFRKLPSAIEGLELCLRKGEFVSYTIRDLKEVCSVSLLLRGMCRSVLAVSGGGRENRLEISEEKEAQEIRTLLLEKGDEYMVRLEVIEGEIYLEEVSFR